MPLFFFDRWYILLVLPAALIALWAQIRVKTTFSRYSGMRSRRNLTGAEVARMILDANGLQSVQVHRVSGNLTDHYDPRKNVIRLSDSVYDKTSIAAIGVAAHETGHALQYAAHYVPIKIRTAIIPITQLGSSLSLPLILVGLLFGGMEWLVWTGIILFSAVVLFQLITLPVEFNASARALRILSSENILESDETSGAKRVLSAAAMTYVASLLVALAQLLRLLLVFGNRRGRD